MADFQDPLLSNQKMSGNYYSEGDLEKRLRIALQTPPAEVRMPMASFQQSFGLGPDLSGAGNYNEMDEGYFEDAGDMHPVSAVASAPYGEPTSLEQAQQFVREAWITADADARFSLHEALRQLEETWPATATPVEPPSLPSELLDPQLRFLSSVEPQDPLPSPSPQFVQSTDNEDHVDASSVAAPDSEDGPPVAFTRLVLPGPVFEEDGKIYSAAERALYSVEFDSSSKPIWPKDREFRVGPASKRWKLQNIINGGRLRFEGVAKEIVHKAMIENSFFGPLGAPGGDVCMAQLYSSFQCHDMPGDDGYQIWINNLVREKLCNKVTRDGWGWKHNGWAVKLHRDQPEDQRYVWVGGERAPDYLMTQ